MNSSVNSVKVVINCTALTFAVREECNGPLNVYDSLNNCRKESGTLMKPRLRDH